MKSKEDVDFITIKKNKITGLLTLAIQHGTADDVKALFGINTKLRGMDCDLAIYRNDPDIFHELLTNNKSKLNYYEKSQILNKRVSTSLKILGHPSPQNSLANATGMPPAALAVLVPLDFQPPTGLKICAPQ